MFPLLPPHSESLIKDNRKACVIMRPQLRLLGVAPAPLSLLKDVVFTLMSQDCEGTPSHKTLRNFKLNGEGETVYEFPVPSGLRSLQVHCALLCPILLRVALTVFPLLLLQFRLSASVTLLATGTQQSLLASHDVSVNAFDATDGTMDVFLRTVPGRGYVLSARGKSGEPVPNQELTYAARCGECSPATVFTLLMLCVCTCVHVRLSLCAACVPPSSGLV